jgi:CxxC motif-containing protein (DUF1111 family)
VRVQTITRLLGTLVLALWTTSIVLTQTGPQEAPAAFDGRSNGVLSEVPDATGVSPFEEAAEEFTGPETVEDGLGPVFNAAGCGECHATPILGGSSQVAERRAGRWDGSRFQEHPGGSLIQDRSTDARVQETVLSGNNVIALRSSLNVLGDGFIEAIDSNDIVDNASRQPVSMRGTVIEVPVLEAPGRTRVGRFGWKNQHASLLSFSADAYLNEMGITSPMQRTENTNNGRALPPGIDPFPDDLNVPEDDGEDVDLFAAFMRSTKAPPRDQVIRDTTDSRIGSDLFDQVQCGVCHTRTFVTAPRGTLINGGAFRVPTALGSRIIHPFSDFLLHDVGTGDGIVQNGGAGTRNQLRTAPLWGLRTRGRLMHDLQSHSVFDAIQRHGGQAAASRNAFNALTGTDRSRVLRFLSSL